MDAQTAYNKAYAEAVREMCLSDKPSTIGGMSDLDIAIEEKMNDMGFKRIPEFEDHGPRFYTSQMHQQNITTKIKSIDLCDDGTLPPEEQW